MAGWNEQDLVEAKTVASLDGHSQMGVMNRIESAAEEANTPGA
jgi:hypothetical protein